MPFSLRTYLKISLPLERGELLTSTIFSHGARPWKLHHVFDESGESTLRIFSFLLSPLISRPFPDLGEPCVSQAFGRLPQSDERRGTGPAVRHCVGVEIRCSYIEPLFSLLPSPAQQKQPPPIFASPPKYFAAGWREAAGGGFRLSMRGTICSCIHLIDCFRPSKIEPLPMGVI